jgi:hypothetical protein
MNFQDKQGHDDGEYAIAQRFDPVFADFENSCFAAHSSSSWNSLTRF